MANAEDIQIVRNLIAKWVDQQRALRLVRQRSQVSEWEAISEPTWWLAQRALQSAEEFWEEEPVVVDEEITTTIQEPVGEVEVPEQEPWLWARIWKWVVEAFVWDVWEETLWEAWIERWKEALEAFSEWEIIEWLAKWAEFVWQTAAWFINSSVDAIWVTVWELVVRPWLEVLDPDTLQKLSDVSWLPVAWVNKVLQNEWVQQVLWLIQKWIDKIPENLRNDFKALATLIPFKKLVNRFPDIAEWVKTAPWTKLRKVEKVRVKNKTIKDNVNTLIWTTSAKIEDRDLLDFWNLLKENSKQLRWIKDFDKLWITVSNIWLRDINLLNGKLKGIKNTFRPQWAKEALKEMKENVGKINFKTSDKAEINRLISKFDKEWLTLTELNNIKKSINKYTRWWSKSWLEWAWLRAEAVRDKYWEVMKFIENTAEREWIPNVRELNRNWAVSDQFSWFIQQQARKAWVKWVKEQITRPWIVWRTVRGARDIISTPFTKGVSIDTSITAIEKNLDKILSNIIK